MEEIIQRHNLTYLDRGRGPRWKKVLVPALLNEKEEIHAAIRLGVLQDLVRIATAGQVSDDALVGVDTEVIPAEMIPLAAAGKVTWTAARSAGRVVLNRVAAYGQEPLRNVLDFDILDFVLFRGYKHDDAGNQVTLDYEPMDGALPIMDPRDRDYADLLMFAISWYGESVEGRVYGQEQRDENIDAFVRRTAEQDILMVGGPKPIRVLDEPMRKERFRYNYELGTGVTFDRPEDWDEEQPGPDPAKVHVNPIRGLTLQDDPVSFKPLWNSVDYALISFFPKEHVLDEGEGNILNVSGCGAAGTIGGCLYLAERRGELLQEVAKRLDNPQDGFQAVLAVNWHKETTQAGGEEEVIDEVRLRSETIAPAECRE